MLLDCIHRVEIVSKWLTINLHTNDLNKELTPNSELNWTYV